MSNQPWQCPDCGGWFGPSSAHGCGGPATRVVYVPPGADKLAALEAENAKLREENVRLGGASTMMACTGCGKGVRPRYAVRGMCAECAGALIERLRDALWPFARYASANRKKPLPGLGDERHVIHMGTPWEASIRLSDCDAARKALAKLEASDAG